MDRVIRQEHIGQAVITVEVSGVFYNAGRCDDSDNNMIDKIKDFAAKQTQLKNRTSVSEAIDLIIASDLTHEEVSKLSLMSDKISAVLV